jgi:CRP/FNR family cyclic AMP-dependent transcriptional regulator
MTNASNAPGAPNRSSLVDSCGHLPRTTVAAGDVVIAEGQGPGAVLLLVDGAVVVERDGVPFARIDGAGSIFGEMSALLRRPATATVRATTDATFLVADDGEAFLASRPDVALDVARTVAVRLDNLSGYVADVRRQFAGQADHLGMLGDVLETLVHHQAPAVRPGSARMPELDY